MRIIIQNFQKKIPINPKTLKKTILKVLSKETAKETAGNLGVVTVCFVNDKKIKQLNLKFLHKNNPTDVLVFDGSTSSFDKLRTSPERSRGTLTINPKACRRIDMRQIPNSKILADIAISTDTAIRNAKIFKTTPFYELYLYVVHGVLHLLGYDDKNARQRKIMEDKTENILNKLNINANFR